MQSNTQHITLDGHPRDVFAFLADPASLPRWAVGFCRAIHRGADGGWVVETATGGIPIRYVTNAECGTIDFTMQVAPGVEAIAYSRVVANGDGAEYVFTQFQLPGMPDATFAQQVTALAEELQVLRSIVRARAACVA